MLKFYNFRNEYVEKMFENRFKNHQRDKNDRANQISPRWFAGPSRAFL